jgi:hypothetical protein
VTEKKGFITLTPERPARRIPSSCAEQYQSEKILKIKNPFKLPKVTLLQNKLVSFNKFQKALNSIIIKGCPLEQNESHYVWINSNAV